MTCKNCLHYEACKGTYYTAKGCDNIALYDFDGEMYSDSGCEDFKRELQKQNLTPEEYQRAIIQWCKENNY